MKDVTHIERPTLPWRTGEKLTECGLPSERHPTWTRDEVRRQAKELGQTRMHMVTCITCLQTFQRHASWDTDPCGAVAREVASAWRGGHDPRTELMRTELRAVAILISAHQDEFEGIVKSLAETASLADARAAAALRRRTAR